MKMNRKLFLFAVTVLGITWLILIALLCNIAAAGSVGKCGLAFGTFSFLLVFILNLVQKTDEIPNETSAPVIPAYFSIGYICISIILNTVFILVSGNSNGQSQIPEKICLTVNIILTAGALIYSVYILFYLGSLKKKNEIMRDKTEKTVRMSTALKNMLASVKDDVVKESILKLKENIDYGTNTISFQNFEKEKCFFSQLSRIQEAIDNNENSECIIGMIDKALLMWRTRA